MATVGHDRVLRARLADEDIAREKQWHFGVLVGGAGEEGRVELADAGTAGAKVIEEPNEEGFPVTLCMSGQTKAVAAAAIAPDDLVAVGANNRAVVAAGGAAVVGRAIDGAAAAGDLFSFYAFDTGE